MSALAIFSNHKFNIGQHPNFFGNALLTYDSTTHVLNLTGTIYADNNLSGTVYEVNDSRTINLFNKFGSSMYLGFTAATGGSTANQFITSWDYGVVQTVPEPSTYGLLLTGLGVVTCTTKRRNQPHT